MKTKITLITATYNSAKTVRDTLLSVNKQTYENIEHIIIDGKSSDETLEIVSKEGERVSKVVSENDKGIYDAYNKGLAEASGEIIGFINSDDYYSSSDVITQVMDIFEKSDVEACHADLAYVDPIDISRVQRIWRSKDVSAKTLSNGYIPAHPTVFFRKSVYDKIGGFDLKYRLAADYEFLLRAFYTNKVTSVHVPKIWVRMRAGGATGGTFGSIKRQNQEIRTAQKYHNLKSSAINFYIRKIIDRLWQKWLSRSVKVPDLLAESEGR